MTQPRLVLLIVAGAMLAAAVAPEFHVTLLSYVGLYSLVALGLVLLTGIGGLTSFGQAAFVGVGAYATAILSVRYGWSPWETLVLGIGVAAMIALALGAITLRLAGHYLPLGTIAWGISLYYLFGNIDALGGHTGITGVPSIAIFGHVLADQREMAVLIWLCVGACVLTALNLLDSRVGRAIRSLRGGGVMAESFGIDTAAIKIALFVYAAILAAISGWLYAHMLRFVNPTPFSLGAGIEYLFMIVIGGAGQVWGAILGATALTLLRHLLQDYLPRLFGTGGNYELIAFGILMIVLLQQSRTGLAALASRWWPRTSPPVPDAPAAVSLPGRARPAGDDPILAIERLRKSFGSIIAVSDVSFALRAGEILGLIGPNGAGKTTTFNLVSAVLAASGGKIRFLGRRIDRLQARKIAALGIARTFQHVRLRPTMTVLDNVALGAHLRGRAGFLRGLLRLDRSEEAMIRAEALRQLGRVGLRDHAFAAAGTLPLGQQRILEIARALCADPVLLLLDEPAAGLRHQEKLALAEVLRQLRAEGMSILLVEHDMDFVMGIVDRLVVMDFGRMIAEGLPAVVRRDPAVIEAYLGSAR